MVKFEKSMPYSIVKIPEFCYNSITKYYPNILTIYLNFSDPWPKKRHSDRRLSSLKFLKRYDSLFKNEK